MKSFPKAYYPDGYPVENFVDEVDEWCNELRKLCQDTINESYIAKKGPFMDVVEYIAEAKAEFARKVLELLGETEK